MSFASRSLRAVLGVPCPQRPLPPVRSSQWAACRDRLRRAPAGSELPPHSGDSCTQGAPPLGAPPGERSAGTRPSLNYSTPRRAPPPLDGAFASWNVRWMIGHHTAVAGGKRRAIEKSLAKQHAVLLQETHWFESALGIWEAGTFLHTRVVAATTRPGNEGGPQGGVAIVCPIPHRVVEHATLVP